MIDFPSAPVVGQAYTAAGRTWLWTGTAWKRQLNSGQQVSVFYEIGPLVHQVAALPAIGNAFAQINYV